MMMATCSTGDSFFPRNDAPAAMVQASSRAMRTAWLLAMMSCTRGMLPS